MLSKRTIIDQIEITSAGPVQVRFLKQIVEDGKVLSSEYHRTSIVPGADADAVMAAVNAHLGEMGCATCEDWHSIKNYVAQAHTPKIVKQWKNRAVPGGV